MTAPCAVCGSAVGVTDNRTNAHGTLDRGMCPGSHQPATHPYAPNPHYKARPAVHVYPNCAACNEPYWSALHPVGTQPHAQNGATA